MGIKQFFKLFKGHKISLNDIEDSTIAVDCMPLLYRSLLGMPNTHSLTDADGNSTVHINYLLLMITKFQKHNINQIYVFDSPIAVPEKKDELMRRANSDRPKLDFNNIIKDTKQLLSLMGIPWVVAPDGFDAEHVCSELFKLNKVDYVLTNDADAFLYGADYVIRYEIVSKKTIMVLYNIDDLKLTNKLTHDDLLKISVMLGCDFCDKTPRVGIKTVIKKFKDIELTEKQIATINVFNRAIVVPKIETSDPNKTELTNWLVSKGFSYDRVAKILA